MPWRQERLVHVLRNRWLVLGVVCALALPRTSWACPGSQDKECATETSTTLDLGVVTQQQLVSQTDAASFHTAQPVATVPSIELRYATFDGASSPQTTIPGTGTDTIGVESCVLKFPIYTTMEDNTILTASTTRDTKASQKSGDGALLVVGGCVWVSGTTTNPKTGVTLTSSGTWYGPASAPFGH